MRRAGGGVLALTAGVLLWGAGAGPPSALVDFEKRVDEYVALHKAAAHPLPSLDKRTDPAAIAAHEKALADGIRRRRASARPGDIFGPGVRALIADMIATELASPTGASERRQILEQNPETETPEEPVTVAVNAAYAPGASLSSVPAGLLGRLPPLPKELDYRFVGRHLVLRDTVAHLIVDYVANALP
jgi:hypothetical protein